MVDKFFKVGEKYTTKGGYIATCTRIEQVKPNNYVVHQFQLENGLEYIIRYDGEFSHLIDGKALDIEIIK